LARTAERDTGEVGVVTWLQPKSAER
jgi:hypothetical protein